MKEKLQFVNHEKTEAFIKILLTVYVIAALLIDTVVGIRCQTLLQRVAALSGIVLIALFFLKVLSGGVEEIKKYCKSSIWIIFYIIFRIASYLYNGRDYTIARQILFEMIYLLPLCSLLIDKKFVKTVVVKSVVFITLVFNILDFFAVKYLVFCNAKEINNPLSDFIVNNTYGDFWNVSIMYDNPNFMGMITVLAMILAIELFRGKRTWLKIVAAILYYAFGLYMVWISGCRNAQLCIIILLIAFAVEKVIKAIDGRRMAAICLICITIFTGAIYGYVYMNGENYQFSEQEQKISDLSTGRYLAWKSAIYANKDNFVLGCGSITIEKKDRYEYSKKYDLLNSVYNIGRDEKSFLGPHNAYVGIMLSCGVFAFIFYILHLLRRIRKSEMINDMPYGLTVIYVLCSNVLETMLITRFNIFCLVMYLVLAPEINEETNIDIKNEEEAFA